MSNYKKELFEYKLLILQKELDTINQIIERHDKFTQTTKNWAIVIWIGITSFILKDSSTGEMRVLLLFTPFIPVLFWFIDTTWRRLQNRSIFRSEKISRFLNSKEFAKAYETYDLTMEIWDVVGRQYKGDKDFLKRISFWRIFFFRSIWIFYVSIIVLSVLINLFINLV